MTAIELYNKFNAYLEEEIQKCDEIIRETSKTYEQWHYLKSFKPEETIADELTKAKDMHVLYQSKEREFDALHYFIRWYKNGADLNGKDLSLIEMYELLMQKIDEDIRNHMSVYQVECDKANKKIIKYMIETEDYYLNNSNIKETYINDIGFSYFARNVIYLCEMKDKLNEIYYSYSKSYV